MTEKEGSPVQAGRAGRTWGVGSRHRLCGSALQRNASARGHVNTLTTSYPIADAIPDTHSNTRTHADAHTFVDP